MRARCLPVSTAVVLAVFACAVHAQSVISAHSGVIQYVEGDVAIDAQATQPKFAQFPEVKSGQILSTAEGRVEMLLTPGVFLRLAENSSVKMISNALSDTRLEVVNGSALIEVGELLPGNSITVVSGATEISLPKKGLYRIEADTARLRVYDGKAEVLKGEQKVTVKKGREVELDAPKLAAGKFDTKQTDAFYRWSGRRASYVAAANVTSAHVAGNSGYSSGFFSGRSFWSWNPYFGMFTFVPSSGIYQSPFGTSFYSPSMIRFLYIPRQSSPFGFAGGSRIGIGSQGMSRMGPGSLGNPGMSSAPRMAAPSMSPSSGGMSSPRSMSGGRTSR